MTVVCLGELGQVEEGLALLTGEWRCEGRRGKLRSAPLQVSRERKEEGQRGGGGLLHVSSSPDRQSKVLYLEKQVMAQQQEITSLKGVIKNLR